MMSLSAKPGLTTLTSREELESKLHNAESQVQLLLEEIQQLRQTLRSEYGEEPYTTPKFNRMQLDSMGHQTPHHTRDSMPGALFQPSPESLAPQFPPPRPTARAPHPYTPLPDTGLPISATLGTPMPPGFTSPGDEAPPLFFEPEELTPRQQAISQYHQQPFFVDTGFVSRLSPDQLDDLPYGVIQLDAEGRILAYNDTEARLAGYPKERVMGRNFFAIAPCTRVREFEGRFRDLADGKTFSLESFEFVFNFKKGAQRVLIMIFPASRRRGVFNIAIIRK